MSESGASERSENRVRRIQSACFCLLTIAAILAVSGSAQASPLLTPKTRILIEDSQIVDPSVVDLLESVGQVGIRIFLAEDAIDSTKSTDSAVIPAVVNLVSSLLPGAELERPDVLTGVVDAKGLLAVIANEAVLGVELDEQRADSLLGEKTSIICIPSSTAACLNGQFRVQVNGPYGLAGVAAKTSLSAAFHFGNSDNWEMMVKVLFGCGINNHYWVFIGRGTSHNTSISVLNVANGQTKVYGNTCQITDVVAFPCS